MQETESFCFDDSGSKDAWLSDFSAVNATCLLLAGRACHSELFLLYLFCYLVTNFMEKSLSWEANNCFISQEICHLL
jgi:hypothetical protein